MNDIEGAELEAWLGEMYQYVRGWRPNMRKVGCPMLWKSVHYICVCFCLFHQLHSKASYQITLLIISLIHKYFSSCLCHCVCARYTSLELIDGSTESSYTVLLCTSIFLFHFSKSWIEPHVLTFFWQVTSV